MSLWKSVNPKAVCIIEADTEEEAWQMASQHFAENSILATKPRKVTENKTKKLGRIPRNIIDLLNKTKENPNDRG